MPVEPAVPETSYIIASAGPHAVLWPYAQGAVRAYVVKAGIRTDLVEGTDFTMAPLAATVSGALTLSPAAFAAQTGGQLLIYRETVTEQGWTGLLGDREKGLEAQLDLSVMRLQELDGQSKRSVKTPPAELQGLELPPAADRAGKFLAFDALGRAIVSLLSPTGAPVSPFMAAFLQAASAAAAQQGLQLGQIAQKFLDGIPLQFGTDVDAAFSFDNAAGVLREVLGAGIERHMRADIFRLLNATGNKTLAQAFANGAFEAYFDNVKKLATTSVGAEVLGHLIARGSVDNGLTGNIFARNDGLGTAGVTFDAIIRGILVGGLAIQNAGGGKVNFRVLISPPGDDTIDRRVAGWGIDGDGRQWSAHVGAPATFLPQFACRAWADISMITGAIRAAGNFMSITDNGQGDFSFNFSTPMPDANYVVVASCKQQAAAGNAPLMITPAFETGADTFSPNFFRLICWPVGNSIARIDADRVHVAVFR